MSPDYIRPDLAIGVALLLSAALVALGRRDRGRERRANVQPPDLSRLDILDGVGSIRGACLSHNVTCTHPEPHEHGRSCDRSCVCVRTAA